MLELWNQTDFAATYTIRGARRDNYDYLHDRTYSLAPGEVRLVRFPVPYFFQQDEYARAAVDTESGVDAGSFEFPFQFKRATVAALNA